MSRLTKLNILIAFHKTQHKLWSEWFGWHSIAAQKHLGKMLLFSVEKGFIKAIRGR